MSRKFSMQASSEIAVRRACVTGAGGGLGREIAVQLARRGCSVVVLDINAIGAEETAGQCSQAGAEAFAIVDDLTREGAPEDMVGKAVAAWGRLDILVNNAGYGGIEPFLAMTAALWNRTLALNLTALALA